MSNRVPEKEINRAYKLFCDVLSSLDERNWLEQLICFIKEFKNFKETDFEERIFSGWVAAICEQSYYLVAHQKKDEKRIQFEKELKKVFTTSKLPHCLIKNNFVICGKKQPAVVNSIQPTFDRFQVLENLPSLFSDSIDALILGGSMSYVPFLGVRSDYHNNDFSDIDLIFIQSDSFFDDKVWTNFRDTNLLHADEKKIFLKRVREYKKLLNEGRVDILSQRFKIKDQKFTVSTHFFPKEVFKKLVSTELKMRLSKKQDGDYAIRDYRIDSFNHPCQARLSFDGSRIESGVWSESRNVKQGYIATASGFTIKNKKLYPGPYLTVVSPAFQIFYTKSKFAARYVEEFKKILNQQVSIMSVHNEKVSYARAHNRYYLFCPGRYDKGHNSYTSPQESEKNYIVDPVILRSTPIQPWTAKNKSKDVPYQSNTYKQCKNKLKRWAKQELVRMEESIESFIKNNNLQEINISLFRDTYWLTVTTVEARKDIVFKEIGKKTGESSANGGSLYGHVLTHRLFPDDIMSSPAFSVLNTKFGKVYISSHFDPVESENLHPISYSIIVKL